MATYRMSDFDDGADEIVKGLLEAMPRFSDLKDAGVTVEVLLAFAPKNPTTGEPKGAAVKHYGYPAAATVKINSQKDRAAGLKDARVVVDGDRWPDLSAREREALMAHELRHLELWLEEKQGPEGETAEVQLDDSNRPKLRLRQHDVQVGIFFELIEEYGEDAAEYLDLAAAWKQARELVNQQPTPAA